MSPAQEHLPQERHARQGPFLARRARWEWHDNVRIDILDDRDQPILTLDEWQTLVFYQADGNHSLEMITSHYPSHYQDQQMVPAGYDREIAKAAQFLVEERKLVELWERPDDLAYELQLPLSEQSEADRD